MSRGGSGPRKNTKILRWSGDRGCWELELTKGQWTLFDNEDLRKVLEYNWYAAYNKSTQSFYAYSRSKGYTASLGRVILGEPEGLDADHINGNSLDNRRSNLRKATRQQNIANKRRQSNNKSGYKGVRKKKLVKGESWEAHFKAKGIYKYLGTYKTKEDAARAYNEEALKAFGDFARLNEL